MAQQQKPENVSDQNRQEHYQQASHKQGLSQQPAIRGDRATEAGGPSQPRQKTDRRRKYPCKDPTPYRWLKIEETDQSIRRVETSQEVDEARSRRVERKQARDRDWS